MLTLPNVRRMFPEHGNLTDFEFSKVLHRDYYGGTPYEDFATQMGLPQKEDEVALAVQQYNRANPNSPITAQDIRDKDRSGFFGSAALLGEGIWDSITDQLPEDLARMWRGGDIDPAKTGFADEAIRRQEKDRAARIPSLSEVTGSGLAKSMYQGPQSFTTSLATSLAGYAAGGAAGGAVAGPAGAVAGGLLGGSAASGAAFYRIAKDGFVDEVQKAMEAHHGRSLSSEEAKELNAAIDSDATEVGLWEAGTEAISQFFTMGLLRGSGGTVLKRLGLGGMSDAVGKRWFTRIPAKLAAETGEEEITEGITYAGQENVRHSYGLRNTEPSLREFIEDHAGPVAVGSVLQLGSMGLARKVGGYGGRGIAPNAEPNVAPEETEGMQALPPSMATLALPPGSTKRTLELPLGTTMPMGADSTGMPPINMPYTIAMPLRPSGKPGAVDGLLGLVEGNTSLLPAVRNPNTAVRPVENAEHEIMLPHAASMRGVVYPSQQAAQEPAAMPSPMPVEQTPAPVQQNAAPVPELSEHAESVDDFEEVQTNSGISIRFRKSAQEPSLQNREELRAYLESLDAKEIQKLKLSKPEEYMAVLKSIARKFFPYRGALRMREVDGRRDYDHLLKDRARQEYIGSLPSTMKEPDITMEFASKEGDAKAYLIKKYLDKETQKDVWDFLAFRGNEIKTKLVREGRKGAGYIESQILGAGNGVSRSATAGGATENTSTPRSEYKESIQREAPQVQPRLVPINDKAFGLDGIPKGSALDKELFSLSGRQEEGPNGQRWRFMAHKEASVKKLLQRHFGPDFSLESSTPSMVESADTKGENNVAEHHDTRRNFPNGRQPGQEQDDRGTGSQYNDSHDNRGGLAGGIRGGSEITNKRKARVAVPNQEKLPVIYDVVEADHVQPSHLPEQAFQKNPRYGLENERRYHAEPASRDKVIENAARLDPDLLFDAPDANQGAPVVDSEGNVLGGNGRAMSVRYAYERYPERGDAYRSAIKAHAHRLGLDPEAVAGMKNPLLVRRLENSPSKEARQKLVSALNEEFTHSREKRADSKSRGDRLSKRVLSAMADGLRDADSLRSFFDDPASSGIVELFIKDGVIQNTERTAYVGADGLLNSDGKTLVESALRGRIAKSYETLAKLPADIVGKLDAAIPHILVAEGVGGPWNITKDVRDAVDLLAKFKASGGKDAETWLKQVDMMSGKSPIDTVSQYAELIFRNALGLKKAAFVDSFKRYASYAKTSPESNGMPGASPSQEESFRRTIGSALSKEGANKQQDTVQAIAPPVKHAGQDKKETQTGGKQKIEDFGEKIGGARKDVWTQWRTEVKDFSTEDVLSMPMEKLFPEPKYSTMLKEGAEPTSVALLHALRDAIVEIKRKAKNRKVFAGKVQSLLQDASKLLSSDDYQTQLNEKLRKEHSEILDTADLYSIVGHEKSLSGVRITRGSYSIYNSVTYNPAKTIWTVERKAQATSHSNWPKVFAEGSTRQEAIENFQKKYAALDINKPVKSEVSFTLYHDRGKVDEVMIGVKIGRNYVDVAGPFTSNTEARTHLKDNHGKLVEKFNTIKNIPNERRDTNNPRVGEDMRDGQDVSPQIFTDSFGFRGVEFGNWVEGERRQSNLNEAYDALMDLAGIIGVTPKALSLNGELGLAFGARGTIVRIAGGAVPSAHYEADKIVINLTKKSGAGSLAHEWFHAVDNYFARKGGSPKDYISNGDLSTASTSTSVRQEVVVAWGKVRKSILDSGLKERSLALDKTRTTPYFSKNIELGARAFEAYIVEKLQNNNASNDYLVNIVNENAWDGMSKNTHAYPYPKTSEMPAISAAFDNLFQTVEQVKTDKGVALASLRKEPEPRPDSTQVKVVEVDAGIVPEFAKMRELARWLKIYFADKEDEIILSTSKKVHFGKGNIEASMKRSRQREHGKTYGGLNEIVRLAEFDSYEKNDARHPNLGGQEVYYSAMRLNAKLYAVKLKFDVPSVEEVSARKDRRGANTIIEDLRYKDHSLREIEIAPVLYRGVVPESRPTQTQEAISTINLGVLRGAVKPSTISDGVLSSIAPGQFLPSGRKGLYPVKPTVVQNIVDTLQQKAANAAPTEVAQTFKDLPAPLQKSFAGKEKSLEGVYDPATGKVWIVASNILSPDRVADVWMHEQVVHHGLRSMLPPTQMKELLNRLWRDLGGMGNADLKELSQRYGVDPRNDSQARVQIVEEYLAALAEKKYKDALTPTETNLWKRVVEALRLMWRNITKTVSGFTSPVQGPTVDDVLTALGKHVLDGMPVQEQGRKMAGQKEPAFASVNEDKYAAGVAAWEQLQEDSMEWERQLEEFVDSKNLHSLLTVGHTPDVLQKLGAPDLPMSITSDNLGKALSDKPDHALPVELLRQIPSALAQPIMVFESATKADSFVVLTELKHQGRSVMVAVALDKDRQRIRVNEIASAYKRNSEAWYIGQIEDGRLLYQDKTKSLAWARTNRLQLPRVRKLPARLLEGKILTEADIVKPIEPDQGQDMPMASLSLDSIMEGTLPSTAYNYVKRLHDIKRYFNKDDLTLLQRITVLPHWLAKKFPGFAAIYNRQLQRMDERAAALQRSLEQVPSLFGKDALASEDMVSLKKLIWDNDGKKIEELKGVEKFLAKEKLANGRATIEVNPKFYTAYSSWLEKQPGSAKAKKAMLEIRKSLDSDLMLAYNRMAAMKEMRDDDIKQMRTDIGIIPNYFPHHRYGKYYVVGKVGDEVVYREHFDAMGKWDAARKAEKIEAEQQKKFPGAKFTYGKNEKLSEDVYGAPIDTEAMEQIIRAATAKIDNKEQAQKIRDTLTAAIADTMKIRGWAAHSVSRKGIPGFEKEDLAKVLFDYKSGMNGWLTKLEAARDFSEALGKIDASKQPQLWSYASKYVEDMLRNSDKIDRIAGNIKSFAFVWYLGGNLKTATVNMTQNLIVGVPRLQVEVTGSAQTWIAAAGDALTYQVTGSKKTLKADEEKLLHELYGESVITDAFMEEVRGKVSGAKGAAMWNKMTKYMGWPMSVVERHNRASLALAAYRAAKDGKLRPKAMERLGIKKGEVPTYEQAKDFAAEIVRDAHYVYGKSNTPEWMRGSAIARAFSPVFTFRSFSFNMLNMWAWALNTQGKEGAKFVASSLGATLTLGGLTAFPFYATLMALTQVAFGDDDDWTEELRQMMPELNWLRDIACYGIPSLAGVYIGGSLKMETPITRGLEQGASPKEVLAESLGGILGIPYDLFVGKPSKILDAKSKGNYYRMVEEASPVAVKNIMQAWRLYEEGQTTMSGRPINDPGKPGARKFSEGESFGKLLGFQPVSSTKSYEAFAAKNHADNVRSDMIDELTVMGLRGKDHGDQMSVLAMRKRMTEWNERMVDEDKPHMRIQAKDVERRMRARRRENRVTPKTLQQKTRMADVWGT